MPVDQRLCWRCLKPGHVASKCTLPAPRVMAAIEDGRTGDQNQQLKAFFMVEDDEGFMTVNPKLAAKPRPQPRGACVSDFISKNVWDALSAVTLDSSAT